MDLKRATMLVLGALLAAACSPSPVEPEATPTWNYWRSEFDDGSEDFQTAVNHSLEGWLGARAAKPPVSIVYELYDGDRINMALWTPDDALEPSCRRIGCYVYAKGEDTKWTTLRLLPAESGVLYIGAPWGLRELIERSQTIHLEVPLKGERGCVYSFDVRGYSRELHETARLAPTNGAGEEIASSSDKDAKGHIDDEVAPDWVEWPDCGR
jgi:hypothetical protein